MLFRSEKTMGVAGSYPDEVQVIDELLDTDYVLISRGNYILRIQKTDLPSLGVDIIDNLMTPSTAAALSANQGVVLKDLINSLANEVSFRLTALETTQGTYGTIVTYSASDFVLVDSFTSYTEGVDLVLSNKADLVNGMVPASQLPSYVDEILEYANLAAFPVTGDSNKLYVALDSNLIYRWTGSTYGSTNAGLALGETLTTAYRGDRGKTAYDHSQSQIGRAHV